MTKLPIDELEVVAVADGEPAAAPWRPLRPVVRRVGHPETVYWVTSSTDDHAFGFEDDAEHLEVAVADGLATCLPRVLLASPKSVVVRTSEGFELIHAHEAIRRRRRAQTKALREALAACAEGEAESDVRAAFERAYTVDPDDVLTASLRAGAAVASHDEEWIDITLDDLERSIERSGSIEMMLRRPEWRTFRTQKPATRLLKHARHGLDARIADSADLLEPVTPQTQRLGAALAIARRSLKRRLPLSHQLLRRALDGKPDAVDRAWHELLMKDATGEYRTLHDAAAQGSDAWVQSQGDHPRYGARAFTEDFMRFAITLGVVESCARSEQRDSRWKLFASQVTGLQSCRAMPVAPWRQGEELANGLRRQMSMNRPRIEAVVAFMRDEAGTHTANAPLFGDGNQAASVVPHHTAPCAFVEQAAPGVCRGLQNRFALMHELAHLLVDRGRDQRAWVCSISADGSDSAADPAEKRANAFAAYMLAPRDSVRELAGGATPSLDSSDFTTLALRLRDEFGLSAVASGQHLVNCVYPDDERIRLGNDIRLRLSEVDRNHPTTNFKADDDPDPPREEQVPNIIRQGRFAELVRVCVEVGDLDEGDAARVLGIDRSAVQAWG